MRNEEDHKKTGQSARKASFEQAEARYRQQISETYKRLPFSGFEHSDLSLEEVPLEEIFIRLTLTVERRIQQIIPGGSSSSLHEHQASERIVAIQEPITLEQAL